MELLAECEEKYRGSPRSSIPPASSHFPLPCRPFSIRGERSFLTGHSRFAPTIEWKMRRGGKWEKEMGRKRERRKEMPRYTGSRSYRLFLYPEQIIFFVFQRAARLAEALIVTALLSYGSGKLRTVKAFLRQAAPRNPSRRFLRISGTCPRSYEATRPIGIDQCWFSYNLHRVLFHLFPSMYNVYTSGLVLHIPTPSFIREFLDSQLEPDSFSANPNWSCVEKSLSFPSECNSPKRDDKSSRNHLSGFHFTSISMHRILLQFWIIRARDDFFYLFTWQLIVTDEKIKVRITERISVRCGFGFIS